MKNYTNLCNSATNATEQRSQVTQFFFNCHCVYGKDGEDGEEETKFDPGYEPDWAVISTVKHERRQERLPVKETGTILLLADFGCVHFLSPAH